MYSSAKYIAIVWILLLSFSRSSVAFIHRTSNSYLSINIHNDKKSTHNNIIHQSSLVCLAAAKKPWLITVDDWWKKKFKKRLWRREDSDPPSILEQVLIIATVASVITLFMSDPVQSVVNGEKFDEGYRYITMNGKLNELDESYRYSNCKRVARTKTNRDNIYYCQVDSGYIIENDRDSGGYTVGQEYDRSYELMFEGTGCKGMKILLLRYELIAKIQEACS